MNRAALARPGCKPGSTGCCLLRAAEPGIELLTGNFNLKEKLVMNPPPFGSRARRSMRT